MMFKLASFAVSLLLAVSVFADPSFSCGNNPTTDELLAAEKKFVLPDAASPSRRSGDAAEAVTINVYFHVIAKDNTVAGGNIPYVLFPAIRPSKHSCAMCNSDALIQQQMNVLNQDYSRIPTGLSWRLVSVDRTIRPLWATSLTDGSPQEQQMKRTLRKGGPADLNVYTVL
ncbi:hypothetical protein C0991_003785 [Blastosporella zonata]|nr:hypothetical protein C0991_003785 [Blastosporella zonata]